MNAALQIARLVAVLALLCAAAAIATPKGRLPLALRGLAKILNTVPDASRVAGVGQSDAPSHATRRGRTPPSGPFGRLRRGICGYGVSPARRLFAFTLVLLAIILALI